LKLQLETTNETEEVAENSEAPTEDADAVVEDDQVAEKPESSEEK